MPESVQLRAKSSFVNRWAGSVNKKQLFYVPPNIADELVAIGVAEYVTAAKPAEETDPKKSSSSPTSAEGGEAKPSASSPAATPSPKTKSTSPKKPAGK
jgi:hypothetical protein